MQITTLIENLCYGSGLKGEHGFSVHLEHKGVQILFDTGQSDSFMQNADKLGIDIQKVELVVISHGHYDHSGGLLRFLQMNKRAKVYIKESAFEQKYNGKRFIGVDPALNAFKERFINVDRVEQIVPDIYLFPTINLDYPEETHFEGMYTHVKDHEKRDNFEDEQFLALTDKNKINIITGCSHRGIVNIVSTAKKYFNFEVSLVLGGFHLKSASGESLHRTVDFFNQEKVRRVGLSHCSGLEAYRAFVNQFHGEVFYNHTGSVITV